MIISVLPASRFLVRALTFTRLTVQRCLSNNKCPINKPLFQDSKIVIASRKFSLLSFPLEIFSAVVESNASALTQKFFFFLHDSTGLPWWCIVVSSAAILKLTFLPLLVYQFKLGDRCNLVDKRLHEISKRLTYEINEKSRIHKWNRKKCERAFRQQVFLERHKLIVKYNCSPMRKLLLSLLEIPPWIIMSISWRTASYGFSSDITTSKILLSQMLNEGPFWCSNLTIPDPFYIIPAITIINKLCIIKLMLTQNHLSGKTITTSNKIYFLFNGSIVLLLGYFSAILPASVGLFWASSSAMSFINSVALAVPRVRKFFGLSENNYSHKELIGNFKNDILVILRIKG